MSSNVSASFYESVTKFCLTHKRSVEAADEVMDTEDSKTGDTDADVDAKFYEEISNVFGDIELLKREFLPSTDSEVKTEFPIIQYQDILNIYQMLYSLDSPPIKSAFIVGALKILDEISSPDEDSSAAVDLSCIENVLLAIVPLYLNTEMMSDPDNYDEIVNPLLKFSSITAIETLTQFFYHTWGSIALKSYHLMSKNTFSNLIEMLQSYITCGKFMEIPRDQLKFALDVMSVMYNANETRFQNYNQDALITSTQSSTLSYTLFYNDALNAEDTTDLVEEYKNWSKRAAEISGLDSGLCIIDYPFVMEPSRKKDILSIEARVEMRRQYERSIFAGLMSGVIQPYFVLKVNRNDIVNDTLQKVGRTDSIDLKKPLRVKFIGEEGVDEGGVQKEFFQVLMRELFDPKYGMWLYHEKPGVYYFNSNSFEANIQFELAGCLLGLAVFNGVILQDILPSVIYKLLCNKPVSLTDLNQIQPDVVQGLQSILNDSVSKLEEILMLTFTITVDFWGAAKEVPLCSNGENITVTQDNKFEYVKLYVEYILKDSVKDPLNAFKRGFYKVCGGESIQLFRPEELELLICGSPEFDLASLEKVTEYADGFSRESQTIVFFWDVVYSFDIEDQRKLLSFTTGSDRVPIVGLAGLKFVIGRNGPDSDRLPTSHTCFNHLLLPEYKTREKLESRLRLAINQSEGFGLL